MKHVVITGGSRGIGAGLVEQFLSRDHRVTFTGSGDQSLNRANERFSVNYNPDRFRGVLCDITKQRDLETLAGFAVKTGGNIDIWINNAGISNDEKPFADLGTDSYFKVIDTNITGTMMATQVALRTMETKGGSIYNMGGLGSKGRIVKGLIPYGTTKCAVDYFTTGIARELEGTNIRIGLLLPGMVITDMLLESIKKDPLGSKRFIKILNILGDEVDPVADFLVSAMLDNEKNGVTLSYTNFFKTTGRFLSAPFTRRDIVSKYL